MANLYHYTGIEQFTKIVAEEGLYSKVRLWAKDNSRKTNAPYEEALKKAEERTAKWVELNPHEHMRESNVFLSRNLNHASREGVSAGAYYRKQMVVLGFDVPEHIIPADAENTVAIPELSLEHLVEVYAQKPVMKDARKLLNESHDGKYRHIILKEWTK